MREHYILHVITFILIAVLAIMYGKQNVRLNRAEAYQHYLCERIAEDEASMAGQGRLIQQSIRDLAKLGAYDNE